MNYHNTVQESGQQLFNFRQAAINQDVILLGFFRRHAGELLSPSDVWVRTGMEAQAVPLTSVRRAISNLTRDGYLVKTSVKHDGVYGRPENCWTYPRERLAA